MPIKVERIREVRHLDVQWLYTNHVRNDRHDLISYGVHCTALQYPKMNVGVSSSYISSCLFKNLKSAKLRFCKKL